MAMQFYSTSLQTIFQIEPNQQEFLRHAVQALKTLVNNNQHNRDVMRDLGMIATLCRST